MHRRLADERGLRGGGRDMRRHVSSRLHPAAKALDGVNSVFVAVQLRVNHGICVDARYVVSNNTRRSPWRFVLGRFLVRVRALGRGGKPASAWC